MKGTKSPDARILDAIKGLCVKLKEIDQKIEYLIRKTKGGDDSSFNVFKP